jgi:hypothetical protein
VGASVAAAAVLFPICTHSCVICMHSACMEVCWGVVQAAPMLLHAWVRDCMNALLSMSSWHAMQQAGRSIRSWVQPVAHDGSAAVHALAVTVHKQQP